MQIKRIILDVIVSLLVALFIYTAVSKLADLKRFAYEVGNQPLPEMIKPYMLWGVPVLELITALTLMTKRYRETGLFLSVFLMGAFTIYTVLVLAGSFSHIPCSCGGVIRSLTWGEHLIFNILFLAAGALGIILMRKSKEQPVKGVY